MKNFFRLLVMPLLLVGVLSLTVNAQVKVKFVVNTATYSDTVSNSTSVTVTGNKAAITSWGAGVALTNIGGDYWAGEATFAAGDTVKYKFRVAGGWEDNLTNPYSTGIATNDRVFIVGAKDTTLPVQFYNGSGGRKDQYWTPWPTVATGDSLTVWVRVNMQAVIENKSFGWTDADKDSVALMGDNKSASTDIDWGTSHYLKQESKPFFFSGRVRFAKSKVATGDVINYKFRLGYNWGRDELAGGKPNRTFTIPVSLADTTLKYVFYDNQAPIARVNADTVIVTYNVDMANAITKKGFAQGDTLQVQSGFFNTAAENGRTKQMSLVLGTKYTLKDTIVTSLNQNLDYQFYIVKNGQSVREVYFNYDYKGFVNSERERRQVLVTSKNLTVNDNSTDPASARRQPNFPSSAKLSKAVTVKWVVDLRPAYAKVKAGFSLKDDQNAAFTITSTDSIKKYGVGINGPATNLPGVNPVGDWAPWTADMVADTNKRKMWDDGTHGDVTANDSAYTVELTYPIGATAGKVFKFGIRGGDNEAGNGQGFGNNHLENIDDANAAYTITTDFGSINPKYYDYWNFDTHTYTTPTSVGAENGAQPTEFALSQNYPNPFNPSTKIEFAVPVQSNVKLSVFNIVGQEVATLVNGPVSAGKHTVTFNASGFSSGMYFFRLSSGSFNTVKKMVLMK